MGFADEAGFSNHSANDTFDSILEARFGRRRLLVGGLASAAAGFLAGPMAFTRIAGAQGGAGPVATYLDRSAGLLGFESVPMSSVDTVVVPPGYKVRPLISWGDPVNGSSPAWKSDASNTAAEQALQWGMHNDGMHYFPISVAAASDEGLFVSNFEYTDDGLLHVGGMEDWTAEKVAKSIAAHGVGVVHLRRVDGEWTVVDSQYARRVTGATPMALSGPAAGHELLRTAADPEGRRVLGTLNNCAHGFTPWATYLTCEENWNGYFANPDGDVEAVPDIDQKRTILAGQSRYGITKEGFGYRWHEHEERFNASKHPNEPHRFGWVVEINPWDPSSTPTKRTALGRIKHEGAFSTVAPDGRVVIYTGDDERFEYIYKYVSAEPYQKALDAGRSPLDDGTLYVAKFAADGTGTWIPLVHGEGPLTAANGFADQGEVLVRTREAADAVGATKMDRPEWIAQNPMSRELYCALTNNSQRGTEGRAGTDPANPRPQNNYGHIIRWYEAGLDPASTRFEWDIFVLAGDETLGPDKAGNVNGDPFGSPDGLWFDYAGRLWIQTDISTSALGRGDYANLPNNAMLAADPRTGEIRRFLLGPKGCEVTGVVTTPDMRTMFVNIQHPGEPATERSDPAAPQAVSTWPDGPSGGRPRSATVVIEKLDGGQIGT